MSLAEAFPENSEVVRGGKGGEVLRLGLGACAPLSAPKLMKGNQPQHPTCAPQKLTIDVVSRINGVIDELTRLRNDRKVV